MRARERGIRIGLLEPGPANAITDVAGVAVGHANHAPDHTGVSVIVPRAGDDHWLRPFPAGIAVLNGSGELSGLAQVREWGIAETPIFLTGTPYVGAVYEAATLLLTDAQPGIGRDDVLIPIVGECDPSSYCDVRDGPRPDRALVAAALAAARGGAVAEGQVGAGVGMSSFDVAAGIGTASRVAGAYTVGVLVLANFGTGAGERLTVAGHAVGHLLPAVDGPGSEGSCVCVVATDAPLLPAALERLARRSFLGLARVGSTASNGSGELAIAFSTANGPAYARGGPDLRSLETLTNDALSPLFAAAVEASEEAVVNALVAGRPLAGAHGRSLPALPVAEVVAHVARGGNPGSR
jgi:D-aminopeptidase